MSMSEHCLGLPSIAWPVPLRNHVFSMVFTQKYSNFSRVGTIFRGKSPTLSELISELRQRIDFGSVLESSSIHVVIGKNC